MTHVCVPRRKTQIFRWRKSRMIRECVLQKKTRRIPLRKIQMIHVNESLMFGWRKNPMIRTRKMRNPRESGSYLWLTGLLHCLQRYTQINWYISSKNSTLPSWRQHSGSNSCWSRRVQLPGHWPKRELQKPLEGAFPGFVVLII